MTRYLAAVLGITAFVLFMAFNGAVVLRVQHIERRLDTVEAHLEVQRFINLALLHTIEQQTIWIEEHQETIAQERHMFRERMAQ